MDKMAELVEFLKR